MSIHSLFYPFTGLTVNISDGILATVLSVLVVLVALSGFSRMFRLKGVWELTILFILLVATHLYVVGPLIRSGDDSAFQNELFDVCTFTLTIGIMSHLSGLLERVKSRLLRMLLFSVGFILTYWILPNVILLILMVVAYTL
jgi:hypothetical protein